MPSTENNSLLFAPIAHSDWPITFSLITLQKEKIAKIVEFPFFSQRWVENPKSHSPKHHNQKKTNVKQIDSTPDKSDHEDSVNFITKYKELYEHVYHSNYDIDSDNCVAAI